jgi:hypothetical protein
MSMLKHKEPHIKKMFYLSEYICDWLELVANAKETSQSRLVSKILRNYIQEQEHEGTTDRQYLQGTEARLNKAL